MSYLIEIDKVVIAENRQRKTFDPVELNALGDSIEKIGLLHPIVLRVSEGVPYLVAGERRFRAISDLADLGRTFKCYGLGVPAGMIPYTPLGELSPLEAMEAELEENVKRVDLSWQEKAAATAKLAEFRKAQAGAEGKPLPTVAEISLEVRGSAEGIHQETTRKEILLAKHLDNPEVQKAKTAKEAFKVLKKIEESAKNQELAETVGKSYTSAVHTLLNKNCLEEMAEMKDGVFDVILTDPPYGMGADEFGDSGTGGSAGAHFYKDDAAVLDEILSRFPRESFRITKPEAHVYVFCDIRWFFIWCEKMVEAGWRVFRTPLIWHKPAGFRAPWPEHGPQRKYECILYAVKGDKKVLKLAPDVLTHQPDQSTGHPAQKPVALYEDLLSRSARPGDKVFDPFCGSGPIFEAAHNMKLVATGIEFDPAAYGIAVRRLGGLS